MQAYLGDATLKRRLLAEIKRHERADQIVKGTYGEGTGAAFRGCAIGCALHGLNRLQIAAGTRQNAVDCDTGTHARFQGELGIPVELAYHIDMVFENLATAEAHTWPYRVAKAIPTGADLSSVMPALLEWMILDPVMGFYHFAETAEEQDSYRAFAVLVDRDWRDGSVTVSEWDAIDKRLAGARAWARAWTWARAWARAWTWARARARARAGAWARARAGARAWAWARARAGAYHDLSVKTLELLRASTPKGVVTK